MREADRSKAELAEELAVLRQKLARYELGETKRSTVQSVIDKALAEIDGYQSIAEVGIWLWDSFDETATFYGSPTNSEFPFWANIERGISGPWEEIIAPEDLDAVLEIVESWKGSSTGAPLRFRFKGVSGSDRSFREVAMQSCKHLGL
jgi:hypothetical protein